MIEIDDENGDKSVQRRRAGHREAAANAARLLKAKSAEGADEGTEPPGEVKSHTTE